MVQQGEDFGFALKPGEPIRILSEGGRQNLERYIAVELGVSGLIHLAHAAFADLGGGGIGTQMVADVHGHSVRLSEVREQRVDTGIWLKQFHGLRQDVLVAAVSENGRPLGGEVGHVLTTTNPSRTTELLANMMILLSHSELHRKWMAGL